jgi:putative oxidoreductase
MSFAYLIARFLLGTIFLVFGLNGFLHFIPAQQHTAMAGQFLGALFGSGYWVVIFLLQIVGGVLLLLNQFVPLGLTLLAPIIVNIVVFHSCMAPSGLPTAAVLVILWIIVYLGVRSAFAGLFQRRHSV